MADLRQQVQSPSAPRLAEVARALVEQCPQFLVAFLRPHGERLLGRGRLGLEAPRPLRLERRDGAAYRAYGTAEVAGNHRGLLALGTGQEDLTPAEGEGIAAAKPGA